MRDKFLTRKQAASLLRVSVRTLDRLVKTGKIPCYRVGRKVVFSVNRIYEILDVEKINYYSYWESPDAFCLRPAEAKRRFKRTIRMRKLKAKFMKLYEELMEKPPLLECKRREKFKELKKTVEKLEKHIEWEEEMLLLERGHYYDCLDMVDEDAQRLHDEVIDTVAKWHEEARKEDDEFIRSRFIHKTK